ncbi:hypothetical protein [Erwinia piriflorinigrans]|uniref:Uncharacterized protein n=1 Tax=Erwinia piriflorinigrans CFBP 5888 TaxID=1161919 RepID=V5ZC51_9GAMM|nr:hypothetical protein [Erwinia piriflorinigrans]CCG88486.1 hypothetical protein EPIR_3123 [Erwinia piriflorinigrans CFBP 5888]
MSKTFSIPPSAIRQGGPARPLPDKVQAICAGQDRITGGRNE